MQVFIADYFFKSKLADDFSYADIQVAYHIEVVSHDTVHLFICKSSLKFYYFYFLLLFIILQVEVKIDNMQESLKDLVLSNFDIEAAVYDTKSWYKSGGFSYELSPEVANLKLNSSPSPILGFHGYLLEGKLDSPNLWSAEQVSSS